VHTRGTLSSGKKRLTALKRYCIGPLKRDRPGPCPQSIVSASCVEAKTLAVRAFLRATLHSTRRLLNSIYFIGGLFLSGWLGAPQPPMSPPAGGSAARPGLSAPLCSPKQTGTALPLIHPRPGSWSHIPRSPRASPSMSCHDQVGARHPGVATLHNCSTAGKLRGHESEASAIPVRRHATAWKCVAEMTQRTTPMES